SDNSKTASRDTARSPATTAPLASLAGIDALVGVLWHGILGTISAIPETENTQGCQEDVWLSNQDSNHSMHFICIPSNRPKTLTNRASRPLFLPWRGSLRLAFNGAVIFSRCGGKPARLEAAHRGFGPWAFVTGQLRLAHPGRMAMRHG